LHDAALRVRADLWLAGLEQRAALAPERLAAARQVALLQLVVAMV
jgi:hypothetical protein